MLDPAGITTAPLNQTVQIGKNVPFYRWVDENPTPTIAWVHESSVGRGNKLHFGLTRFTDAGYTYDADSGKGGRTYLDVTGKQLDSYKDFHRKGSVWASELIIIATSAEPVYLRLCQHVQLVVVGVRVTVVVTEAESKSPLNICFPLL